MNFNDYLIYYKNKYKYTKINVKRDLYQESIDISYEDLNRKLQKQNNYKIFNRNLRDISYSWIQERKKKLDNISNLEFYNIINQKFCSENVEKHLPQISQPLITNKTWEMNIDKDEHVSNKLPTLIEKANIKSPILTENRRTTIDSWSRSQYKYNLISRRHTFNE